MAHNNLSHLYVIKKSNILQKTVFSLKKQFKLYIIIKNTYYLYGGKYMQEVKVNRIYRHFKGDYYIVQGIRNT